MKLGKIVRSAVLGTVAWKLLKGRVERRGQARRRSQAGLAGGVLFIAGAGVAWMYREEIAALLQPTPSQPAQPLAEKYAPPPPSHKKQQAIERREAAEKRAREQAAHKPAVVRVEKDAPPDLAVKLGDALKH